MRLGIIARLSTSWNVAAGAKGHSSAMKRSGPMRRYTSWPAPDPSGPATQPRLRVPRHPTARRPLRLSGCIRREAFASLALCTRRGRAMALKPEERSNVADPSELHLSQPLQGPRGSSRARLLSQASGAEPQKHPREGRHPTGDEPRATQVRWLSCATLDIFAPGIGDGGCHRYRVGNGIDANVFHFRRAIGIRHWTLPGYADVLTSSLNGRIVLPLAESAGGDPLTSLAMAGP